MKTKQTDVNLLTRAWRLTPKEVKLEEKLAAGSFGEVWKGALHNRWVVAIKKLFPSKSKNQSQNKSSSRTRSRRSMNRNASKSAAASRGLFQDSEIRFLMRTRHERLVMFLGCGISEDGGCFLVMEFMDGGSLDRALWAGQSVSSIASWIQRIQILIDVVDGLAYLHLMHKTVHRDLKSPNILLETIVHNDDATRSDKTVTHRAKLADFGLSRIFNSSKKRISTSEETKKSSRNAIRQANWESTLMKGYVGTPRWMAPEMMSGETKIGPSVDIFSFGVVMWEVWSRRKPWSEFSDKQDIFKAVRDDKKKLKPCRSEKAPSGYENLMDRCVAYESKQRPLIDVIRTELHDILKSAAEIQHRRRSSMEQDNMMSDDSMVMDMRISGEFQGSGAEIEMKTMVLDVDVDEIQEKL